MSTSLLLVDKYRPKSIKELSYHGDLSQKIEGLVQDDLPHVLFYGPSGAGKKTRIMCTLRELYGKGVESLRIDQRTFVTPGGRKLEVNVVQSNHHIELTPSDVGQWDRTVVQEVIKDIAQTQQVDITAKRRFKVVVINEADHLTRDAQAALRRTMEKYTKNLRIILCANSLGSIIGPIKSRCLVLRVASPAPDDGARVLLETAAKADIKLPEHAARALYASADGNLRRALLALEAAWMEDPSFAKAAQGAVPLPDWLSYTQQLARTIIKEQSPQQLLVVRGMLYELLVHCIPGATIIATLCDALLTMDGVKLSTRLRYALIREAAAYEHRTHLGSKVIFHLEAFCAKVMSLYKQEKMGMDWA